jgi:ribonuclease HI
MSAKKNKDLKPIEIYGDGGIRAKGLTPVAAYAYCFHDPAPETRCDFYWYARTMNDFPLTNNIMELTALIKALKKFYKLYGANKHALTVFSDSAYVVNNISKHIKNWKKNDWTIATGAPVQNKELWVELDNISSKFKSITFKHVKGHAGHPQQELCDTNCNRVMDIYQSPSNYHLFEKFDFDFTKKDGKVSKEIRKKLKKFKEIVSDIGVQEAGHFKGWKNVPGSNKPWPCNDTIVKGTLLIDSRWKHIIRHYANLISEKDMNIIDHLIKQSGKLGSFAIENNVSIKGP